MITKQKRPKFLNLFRIHLPVTGVNSFAHRVSGALLFLAIPIFIYCFSESLSNAQGYDAVIQLLKSIPFKILFSVLAWAIGHHLLAGIRFLLIDVDVGVSLKIARMTAWVINVAGIIVFLLIGSYIWL